MSHYPEPIERHQNAINLVREELRKIHACASKNSISRATVQTGPKEVQTCNYTMNQRAIAWRDGKLLDHRDCNHPSNVTGAKGPEEAREQ